MDQRRWVVLAGAAAGYLLVLVWVFLPFIQNGDLLAGGRSIDLNGCLWYQWAVKKSILGFDFHSFLRTTLLAYPTGKNVVLDLGFPLLEICSVPLQALFDLPARHNILLAIIFLLNALAAFVLINHLTKDAWSAFLGGLFFAVNPYVFFQLDVGRVQTACVFGIPLCVYGFLKLKEAGSGRNIVLAALALLFNSLLYWYYSNFLILFLALFVLYFFIAEERNGRLAWSAARVLLLYGALMLLLFSYPVLIQGGRPAGYSLPTDFLHMTRNNSLQFLPADFLWQCLILAAAALLPWFFSKDRLFFALCAAAFMILSLGPYLQVQDRAVPLPYILLHQYIPFFSRLRWPVNCFAMVLLCAAILLSSLARQVFAGIRDQVRPVFMTALGALFLLVFIPGGTGAPHSRLAMDTMPPFQKQPVYRYLSGQADCAILELPFDTVLDFMANQTVHGKKVFNAPGAGFKDSLWPKAQLRLLRDIRFLAYADALCASSGNQRKAWPPPAPTREEMLLGLQQLRALGFEFIVVQPRYAASYPHGRAILEELRRTLKKPLQEYPDGVRLFKIQNLIENG
ncbi:MAG: hypothetical protein PHX05_11090 [Acidobacteriota bacterium]|nr:hypothetical protein [Acidobacteriota bacterium]